MKLIVNKPQRYAKMRAHTATHLLHAILEKVLGQTKQEGSLVDEDYLRFDFATKQALTLEQLRDIENQINNDIVNALPVLVDEMSLEDAKQTGAKMFFGDKYGETVRVVSIGEDVSTELCGGTHVANTSDIGAFVIVSQEAVASGTKRIVAYTGPKVATYAQDKQSIIDGIMADIGVAGESQLLPKIQKMITEQKEQSSQIESLKAKLVGGVLAGLDLSPQWSFDGVIAIDDHADLQWLKIKTIATEARNIFDSKTILLYDKEWTFAVLALWSTSAKDLAKKLSLRGGWSDELVQWRDADIASKIS
jgi:alanyl-tRNA synthetase